MSTDQNDIDAYKLTGECGNCICATCKHRGRSACPEPYCLECGPGSYMETCDEYAPDVN